MRPLILIALLCACDSYADDYAEEHRPVVTMSDASSETGTARAECTRGLPVSGGCMCTAAAILQSFADFDNPSWVCVCAAAEKVFASAICVEGF